MAVPRKLRIIRARLADLERDLEVERQLSRAATGAAIRSRRKRHGATLADVAREMGRSKCHISDIEAGRRPASDLFLEAFFARF